VRTAVVGMAGSGKTVLASMLIQDSDVQARFPDGIIALIIGQNPNTAHLESELQQIPLALGESPENWSRSSAYDRILMGMKDRAILLVLDDIWDVRDGWLPPLGNRSSAIITSRCGSLSSALFGLDLIEVDPLEEEEARQLLAGRIGIQVATLPSQSDAILKLCGGNPFAISMVGGMLRAANLWDEILQLLTECAVVLLKPGIAQWRDVLLFRDPA
jgi:hypothetical protein